MQRKNKRIRLFFIVLYFGIVSIYLLTCLTPFLNPAKFWFIAILGLGFPFLLLLMLICLVVCVFMRSKWTLLAVAVLLLSWQQISALFGFHIRKEFQADKSDTDLRVLSWNVSSWTEEIGSADKAEAADESTVNDQGKHAENWSLTGYIYRLFGTVRSYYDKDFLIKNSFFKKLW